MKGVRANFPIAPKASRQTGWGGVLREFSPLDFPQIFEQINSTNFQIPCQAQNIGNKNFPVIGIENLAHLENVWYLVTTQM